MTQAATKSLIDITEVRKSLAILTEPGQVTELRILNATTQSSPRYPYTASGYFSDTEALIRELTTLRTAQGVYITLQPCKRDLLARAKNRLRSADEMKKGPTTADNHIDCYRWLLIDCDPERPAGISSSDQEHQAALTRSLEIQSVLSRLEWPEPIRADSGNGAHLLYKIDLPVTESTLIQRVLIGLAGMFDVEGLHIDQTVYNPSRISKLYGSLACKGDDTDERPHRTSNILTIPESIAIVPRAMLEAMAAPEQPKKVSSQAQAFDIERFIQECYLDVIGPKPWNGGDKWVFNTCPWNSEHTDRSAYILKFSSGAIAAGCHHNGCRGLGWKDLRSKYEPAKDKNKKNTRDRDFTEEFKKEYFGSQVNDRPGQNAANGHKPELPDVIVGGQLRDTTKYALKALAEAESKKSTIFVQAGRYTLVRVCKDKEGRPVPTPMGVAEVKHSMTHSANYGTLKENKKTGEFEFLNVSPPKEVAEQILSLPPGDWPFPLLEAIVEVPQLRPDGSILDTPGYDEATKLYYAPQKGLVIPEIPIHPTKAEIEQAAEFVCGFINDFPWVNPKVDRANALGLWETIVIRNSVRHVPLALINATAPGTGKGLLTDGTALIATGKTASSLSQIDNDEEWDKRITALLMKSTTMISIDNVEGMLKSSVLSKALTMDYHNGRVLGLSQMVDVPQRAIWIANGNNIQLGGDMPRRCYPINMAVLVSNPWTREDFKYPHFIKAITENRGKIIAALLTMARGWFDAGQPAPKKKLGKLATFSEWVDTVGGILAHAGVEGFLENIIQMHEKADIEGKAWALFLETWLKKLDKDAYTTKDLIDKWKEDSELAETLPDPIAIWFQDEIKTLKNKVGKHLAKKEGRPYGPDNLRIVKGENTDAKVATFKVTGYTGYTGRKTHLREDEKFSPSQADNNERSDIEHDTNNTPDTPYAPYTSQADIPGKHVGGVCAICDFDARDYVLVEELATGRYKWICPKCPCPVNHEVTPLAFYCDFCSRPGHEMRLNTAGRVIIRLSKEKSEEDYRQAKSFVDRHEAEIRAILKEQAQA